MTNFVNSLDDLSNETIINDTIGWLSELVEVKDDVTNILSEQDALNEIEHYIQNKNFDWLISKLENFDTKYHEIIACKLMDAWKWELIYKKLTWFKHSNYTNIILELIWYWYIENLKSVFVSIEWLDYNEIISELLESYYIDFVKENFSLFKWLTNYTALTLLHEYEDFEELIYINFDNFVWLYFDVASILLDSEYISSMDDLSEFFSKFDWLDTFEWALYLPKSTVWNYFDYFKLSEDQKEIIVLEIIEDNWIDFLITSPKYLKYVWDLDLIFKLIKTRNEDVVVNNLDIINLNDEDLFNLEEYLIKNISAKNVLKNVSKFRKIKWKELVQNLHDNSGFYLDVFLYNLNLFNFLNKWELISCILDYSSSDSMDWSWETLILDNYDSIVWNYPFDKLASELIEEWKVDFLCNEIRDIKWFNLDEEFAQILLKWKWCVYLMENIDSFYIDKGSVILAEISSIEEKLLPIKKEIILWNNNLSEWLDEMFDLNSISRLVYPQRDYSSKNIDNCGDKTSHIENYVFDRQWYNFTLSNLLGYRLIDWQKIDSDLLEKFKNNVKHISIISKDKETLVNWVLDYCKIEWIELESKNLESKILEYLLKKELKWKDLDIEDFDLLIAYQLMWKYDEFSQASNDVLALYSDEQSKYMIQIQALSREYWDVLKDSIRKLERITLRSSDREYFEQFFVKTPKEVSDLVKTKTINSIIRSFSSRPFETITLEIVKKSIDTKLKSILQTTDILELDRNNFIEEFSDQDFMFGNDDELQKKFENKWKEKVKKHFWNPDQLWLNIKKIAFIQEWIYNSLQSESNKFESITDKDGKNKERKVFARFWKTKFDAYARWVWDVCLWDDNKMWKNVNYFEFVMFDTERLKNIWTVMLLNMDEWHWNKYLLFWPNPSVEFDDKVSSKKLYEQISKIVTNFAKDNNYDWVLFDSSHWRSTNRSGEFYNALVRSQLKNDEWEVEKICLKENHHLWIWAGVSYDYKDNLSFLWKRV